MGLSIGTRIGNYEVESPQGAGGMGEVYRARDTRLDRAVAIKSLPPAFASDAERLARFEREAKLLASLSHPNIAAIFGLEDMGGAPYLVLEFIEGETLSERLAQGPLPVRETLEIAVQVAAAIEAAHTRGIVHRDLKPGNIMRSTSGIVKVLDFGLAKGGAREDATPIDPSASPTMGADATAQGIVLGTAPYMSPEQARGKAVDRRADVWAFGCFLFECLTGHRAFEGATISDVIARILEREPNWGTLPAETPARLRDLMQRCLTKDAEKRPRDIGDLRRELEGIIAQISSPSGMSRADDLERPSLAVLYFENLSSDSDSEYFCSGITEDILTDLSKIRGLRVASRNAVERYRGTHVDLPRVASELGVRAVLEGSVRRAGDRVRITAQLINAVDGFHLWAERYDRTLEDVFAVQEEIAKSIAEALRVALTPTESKALVRDRPDDVRAYDLYLRGRRQYGTYTPQGLRAALELFQQAIAVDSGYALAWAGVSDCYGQLMQYEYSIDAEEAARLGLEAARRAIALNPSLAEGHKAEALVRRGMGDREGVQAALRRALEANPRFTPALINLGVDSMTDANLAATERYVRRVLEIDPQDLFATLWLAQVLILTSREEEALAAANRMREQSSELFYVTAALGLRAWACLRRGDSEGIEQALREGVADQADPSTIRAIEAALAARSGRVQEARKLLDGLENAPRLGPGALAVAAGAAVRLGDPSYGARFQAGRRFIKEFVHWIIRLDPQLHPLLDYEPFAPRRALGTLVWPLEAPMIDPVRFALFKEVRIESGLPQASESLRSDSR